MWKCGGRKLQWLGKVNGGWEGDVRVMRELGCGRVSRGRVESDGRAPFSRRLTQRFPSAGSTGSRSWDATWRRANRSDSFGLRRTAGNESGTASAMVVRVKGK